MTDKFISIEGIARRYPGADGGQISVFEDLWLSMPRGEFGCYLCSDGGSKPWRVRFRAPSFVALDKTTGKVVWKDNSPGKNILDGQWANPAAAQSSGKP